jgi:hypothetical protein
MMALNAILNIIKTRQFEQEDATAYLQRLRLPAEAAVDVCGGPFAPQNCLSIIPGDDDDAEPTIGVDNEQRERFEVCIFLHGLDPQRHKDWVTWLDTSYVADDNHYPKTLREALTQAMDREEKIKTAKKKQQHKQDKDKKNPSGEKYGIPPGDTSFVQAKQNGKAYKTMLCQTCGGKGHSALVCPNTIRDAEVLNDDGGHADRQFFAGAWKDVSDPSVYCNFD